MEKAKDDLRLLKIFFRASYLEIQLNLTYTCILFSRSYLLFIFEFALPMQNIAVIITLSITIHFLDTRFRKVRQTVEANRLILPLDITNLTSILHVS